jgi:hypothetical protein
MTKQRMYCWSCCAITEFTIEDPEEGPVCRCGHWQTSEAQDAADICRLATWRDRTEYERIASIARADGFSVPDSPPYVDLRDEGSHCDCPSLINGHQAGCAFALEMERR